MKEIILLKLAYIADCLRLIMPISLIAPPEYSFKRKVCQKRERLRALKQSRKNTAINRRGTRHK